MARAKRYSPLTVRILAVNVLALLMLGGGMLYLGRYEDRLIQSELEGLTFEARIFASALGEGAVIDSGDERNFLSADLSASMVRRLVEASDSRTRLFDEAGALLADSRILASRRQSIQIEPIAPPDGAGPAERAWLRAIGWMGRKLAQSDYTLYREKAEQEANDYRLARQALQGASATQIWRLNRGGLVLGAAVPVQAFKQVLGAVMVTRSSAKIDAAIAEIRSDIVKIFCAVLALTILLSLYLARTIVKPLQKLATAVRDVKQDQARATGLGGGAALLASRRIPDLTSRRDEVGELSHALREMTAALALRLGAIENFAADVAHEIKNPLTSLRSAVETAERIKDPIRLEKLMAVIRDDIGRMDRLITDIAGASRLDAELSRAETTAVSLRHMLQTLVNLYAPVADAAAAAPVLLRSDVPENAVIQGVESRLMQVLRNLVENARSFTPRGGSVRLSVALEDAHIHILVEDDGPGIPDNKLETIFDRFYSERPTGEKFGQHSGLGLSIARQIIEAHRGKIWAENRRDETGKILGARFTTMLPLAV